MTGLSGTRSTARRASWRAGLFVSLPAALLLSTFVLAGSSYAVGERFAVVIGVGRYKDPRIPELRFAAEDARSFAKLLSDPFAGGIPESNLKVLVDEEATRGAVLAALGTWLSRNAGEDDTVIIYYAGHGAPEIDPTSTSIDGFTKYIVPHDADPDDLFSTAIPMADLNRIFARIPSKRLVLLADACYSGVAGGRTFYNGPTERALNISREFMRDIAQGEGRVVVTSSDSNEVAIELPETGHGLFTHYLLRGMRGEADQDADGRITVQEIYDYVYDRVVGHSRRRGGSQHPVLWGAMRGEIVLAMAPGAGDLILRSSPSGKISVEVNMPDVELFLNGRSVWVSTADEKTYTRVVREGSYSVVARREDGETYDRLLKIHDGESETLWFGFGPRFRYPRWDRAFWGRSLFGTGLAGLVGSAGYYGVSYNDLARRDLYTDEDVSAARQDYSEIRKMSLIGGGVSALTMGLGTYLWFTHDPFPALPQGMDLGWGPAGRDGWGVTLQLNR
ncbi:MAG: caspase family protein [Nitrospirae bacterium]|nr:caspase family protein [Nitrospirota bacterium]